MKRLLDIEELSVNVFDLETPIEASHDATCDSFSRVIPDKAFFWGDDETAKVSKTQKSSSVIPSSKTQSSKGGEKGCKKLAETMTTKIVKGVAEELKKL